MTPEQQQIMIAVACGWKILDTPELYGSYACYAKDPTGKPFPGIPDYLHDLNAMHDAEQSVVYRDEHGCGLKYSQNLRRITEADRSFERWQWGATATQRAEAFLRTIGKWIE